MRPTCTRTDCDAQKHTAEGVPLLAVVLDTCVFYPAHLRDTLLRLAERGLYRALWSAGIVDELHRNLVEDGRNAVSVDRLIAEMAAAFPDSGSGWLSVVDRRTELPRHAGAGRAAGGRRRR